MPSVLAMSTTPRNLTRSDTTSLCVDTQDYLVICERAFPNPKYGWSWCAVDDESLVMSDKRLDFRYLQDNFHLYQAPIEPTRVLDLKAASGYWADKVALVNGSATVLGIDIAPVQYATEPNCYFEFHNVNWEWARAPGSFDLIRGSKLLGNVKDWPSLFRSAYKCLMPGGFLELYDPLFSYLSASDDGELSWKSVSRQACELGKKTSCSFAIAPGMYTRHMVRAGFVDIQEKWESADVTKYELHDVESMLRLLWYLEGVDDQEIWARLGDWRSRLTSEADSVRVRQVAVLGRKPFDGEITLASEG
ncbi:S-adenosyl-L-methionine-dependent methyltransferase [Canariomyces notabilis]|uniref:S-adenosyl-L-methionine-dependent methyltransferase n=1 Tax=Canariomyces notabilis TaxID=2074819 RepID=A0AAN6QD76_9PEZI|nr:S-adenosyl-L-methionine-dependent methyltransferase [Canariomyces arenarius]